jgi:hypothetical protein|tara:strand:+ start:794 stop:1276 length:483 start_codon:yes stop_codon:yes gene_type:complete
MNLSVATIANSPSLMRLLEEAIEEGCLKYQFNVTEKKYATRVFASLFLSPLKEGRLIIAIDGDAIIGFSAFAESEFCGTIFLDGIFIFVKKEYRMGGISKKLRFKAIEGKDMKGKIARYSVAIDNKEGSISASNFAKGISAKGMDVKLKPVGIIYEARIG